MAGEHQLRLADLLDGRLPKPDPAALAAINRLRKHGVHPKRIAAALVQLAASHEHAIEQLQAHCDEQERIINELRDDLERTDAAWDVLKARLPASMLEKEIAHEH